MLDYPSESAPPLSGEDGGEFPLPPNSGQALGGLPHGLAVVDLTDLLPPLSSTDPSFTAEGRALLTSCRAESDSLMVRALTAGTQPITGACVTLTPLKTKHSTLAYWQMDIMLILWNFQTSNHCSIPADI